MISVLLDGRDDSYGDNLHNRAALGLNRIAEMRDAAVAGPCPGRAAR